MCNIFLFDWGSIAGSHDFRAFLYNTAELQKVDLRDLQVSEALPFWLNVYGILLLHLYIMKRPPCDMTMFGRKSFFSTYKYNIGGLEYSLKDIEEGIIRNHIHKKFKEKDPRHRFALKTDPRAAFLIPLLTKTSPAVRVYTGGVGWDAVLTRCTEAFVQKFAEVDLDKKKIRLPDQAKEVYENDFRGKKEELMLWVSQFFSVDQKVQLERLVAITKKFSVSFDDFDWTPEPGFEEA